MDSSHQFDSILHSSAEYSKKFTRELAKNLTKHSNNSKIRDSLVCLNHSPNNLLLSKNFKHMPFSYSITPKTTQINSFQEKFQSKDLRPSIKKLNNPEEYSKNADLENEGHQKSFNNSSKRVYQIGSLSIEKSSKGVIEDSNNKENLLSEIKSLNEKFNMILSNDQPNPKGFVENTPQITKEDDSTSRKKLGDRTNSISKKTPSTSVNNNYGEFDGQIKDFKSFDGLEFETQRKMLEKHTLQKKMEMSSIDRELQQKTSDLEKLKKEFDDLTSKLREKKSEYQKVSIEFDLYFQHHELKQKQIEFNKQQENIKNEQEKAEIDANRQQLTRFHQDLKEREANAINKEKENAKILKEIEGQLQNLDLQKYEVSENLKKCYDLDTEFKFRNEKQLEKEKILAEERHELEQRERNLEEKLLEFSRKEKEICNENNNINQNKSENIEKSRELESLEKNLKKSLQELQEKEVHLGKKEKELCKVIEEIKFFSTNLKNEKQQQEKRLKNWEDNLKKKEEDLIMKEKLLIEKSCKDEDLELKIMGLKMNEDTFRKKLDIEIRNYQLELQKLMDKEKDLVQREKKVIEIEKKYKNQRVQNNDLISQNNMANTTSKKVLKNELHKIFNQDKKSHRLQKSQSFIVLRKGMSRLEE